MKQGSGFRKKMIAHKAATVGRALDRATIGRNETIVHFKFQIANWQSSKTRLSSLISHPSSLILVKKRAINCPHPGAFSILEVILALAILAGAMVVLGELARMGMRNAKLTQDLTRAQLLCESKMAEFTSGITVPQTVQGASFDAVDQDSKIPWVYSVEMEQIDQDGLIALRVTVSQNLPAAQRPATFTLVRWITDPGIEQAVSTTEESMAGSSSGTGTTNAQ